MLQNARRVLEQTSIWWQCDDFAQTGVTLIFFEFTSFPTAVHVHGLLSVCAVFLLRAERQRAEAVKSAVTRALVGVGRSVACGMTQERKRREAQQTTVKTMPTTERATSGGVGRVGAFEVQVQADMTACLSDLAVQYFPSRLCRSLRFYNASGHT